MKPNNTTKEIKMTYPCITTTGGTDCAVLRVSDLLCYDFDKSEWVKSECGDIGFYGVSDKDKNITADYLRNAKVKIESKEHEVFIRNIASSANLMCAVLNGFAFIFIDFIENANKLITLPLPPKESEEIEGVKTKSKLLKYDPVNGSENPEPNNDIEYREFHGSVAWLYNPYTGSQRHPLDIGSDVLGFGIKPPTPEEELEGKIDKYLKVELSAPLIRNLTRAIINGEIKGLSYKPE